MFLILRPESQDAFLPVFLGFPFRDSLKLFLCFSSAFPAFYLFPTTFLIIGEIQIFPQKSKFKLTIFQGFLKDCGEIFASSILTDLASDLIISFLVNLHHNNLFISSIKCLITFTNNYPLGSTSLRM